MLNSHPLDHTLSLLNESSEYYKFEIGSPVEEGWFTFSDIFEGDAYHKLAALQLTREPKASRRYVGNRVLSSLGWLSSLVGLGSYLVDRRVPDLSWSNLRLHWREEGWADRLALCTPRFYVLPDDPAADHLDATVVPDLNALRDIFREQYETNIAAVIEPLKAKSGLGKGAIWAAAADFCVSQIAAMARQMHRFDFCDSEVAALIQVMGSPLSGKSGILWIQSGERREPFLDRGSCCLWYTVAEEKPSYCSTCPLVPREERIERLRTYMESQHA